jgi:hypothetical protein
MCECMSVWVEQVGKQEKWLSELVDAQVTERVYYMAVRLGPTVGPNATANRNTLAQKESKLDHPVNSQSLY